MLEMTIQVPEPLAEELSSQRERLPEVLAYGLQQLSPLPNEIYPSHQHWPYDRQTTEIQ
ncbi:MAG: hypothetical protein KDE19_01970 [Caldilineaceae bacterium]|nr:hypothetical protein [Caldilineaceae bacterium]